MKLSGGEITVLVITALLLALMAGYSLGTGQTHPLEPGTAQTPAVSEAPGESAPMEAPKVDINSAGLEELMTLPGIGETRARAILDYRAEHGSFSFVEDLVQVPGIGESTVHGLLEYAEAGGTEYAENTGG